MKYSFLIFSILCISFSFGQVRNVTISGLVSGKGIDTESVVVSNLTSGVILATNDDGMFAIKVSLGDTLRFSAFNLNPKEVVINKDILQSRKLMVEMTIKTNELKEVVVKNQTITTESVGIISSDIPVYTPAERRLKTASEMKTEVGVNGGAESGISMSLDAIINGISGRTKMLKNELKVERKEFLEEEVTLIYGHNYFITKHKIPSEYVKAFILYLIDDEGFVSNFQIENNPKTEFIITKKSIEFLKRLNEK